jgi:hypothetical protein
VQTARIEKQKTGRTTKGENDLDVVVQKVVNEMFSASGTASAKEAPPARAVPAATRKLSSNDLVADGMDVFSKGRELKRGEVRSLLANTDALRIYNKGVSRRRGGSAMLWSGISLATLGIGTLVYASIEESESNSSSYNNYHSYDDTSESDMMYTLGSLCTTTGGLLIVAGITFRIVGKYTVKKAVKTYNNQYSSSLNYAPELQLGFTGNGVGLVYRF